MALHETHKYDDIIDMPHHVSRRHPQMSRRQRAAQFMPFAALTGYERVIEQAACDAEAARAPCGLPGRNGRMAMPRLPWPGPTPPATPISAPETGLYPKLIFTRVTSDARIME